MTVFLSNDYLCKSNYIRKKNNKLNKFCIKQNGLTGLKC